MNIKDSLSIKQKLYSKRSNLNTVLIIFVLNKLFMRKLKLNYLWISLIGI